MLKTLCGFSVAEIAKSFLTSEDTISKRLYRTKEFFRERKIKPEFPLPDQIKVRTDSVLKTIYLIFNEGYNSTHSDTLIRKDLLDQAFYLCRLICSNPETMLADAFALMALMYFHIARIDSRTNEEGEIILLSDQDRSLWNRKWIDEGNSYMNKAAFGKNVSTYHLEAAIAYQHCSAEKFEDTNWKQILTYYDWLKRIDDSAVVLLNRFAVIYKIYGTERAIKEIELCPVKPELEKHYLYHSLMGEINSGSDNECARKSFERALQMTQSAVEKKLLNKKIAALQND
jgi:RNA polymerase sigma-70 factor (ECF subfamily)